MIHGIPAELANVIFILLTVVHIISYDTSWEILFKHQSILPVVIMYLFLMTCVFDHVIL